jgi:outer membrane protein TolC
MNRTTLLRLWMGLPLALLLAGCTAAHYRKTADRDAYRVIQQKSPKVPNMEPNFTIERTNQLSLAGLPLSTNVPDFLGPDGELERGARILRLEDALDIAVKYSRAYQARKEQLYLSALSLTTERHAFTPIFSGLVSGAFSGASVATNVVSTTTNVVVTPTATNSIITTNTSIAFVDEDTLTGKTTISADWLILGVGKLTAAFTADFLRYVGANAAPNNNSSLTASFVSPLLRDAGYKSQVEALTQAERKLLYDLRDFTRYRRDFSVQIATAYYGVLGNRDAVRNNFLNLQSSRKNAERTRALAEEGRVTQSDLGRLAQQELSAESAWINAIRSYKQALDNFKLQLGLTINERIILSDDELEALQIRHPEIAVEDSIKVALASRLDYLTSKDQLVDADRKLKLSADKLKPGLTLTSSVTLNSDPAKANGFALPDFKLYSYDAGLAFDPGLDKTADRFAYRSALISRDSAARAVDQQEDEIKLQVRDSWRSLDQAKRSFEISEIGVKLAERRVEEQTILAELGRAKAQDQVDAQNALVDSKNQRTQALVAHTIARLQFWNNMGILYIKDRGQWEEIKDEKAR